MKRFPALGIFTSVSQLNGGEASRTPDPTGHFPPRLLQKGFPRDIGGDHDVLPLKTIHFDGFNIAELIQNV